MKTKSPVLFCVKFGSYYVNWMDQPPQHPIILYFKTLSPVSSSLQNLHSNHALGELKLNLVPLPSIERRMKPQGKKLFQSRCVDVDHQSPVAGTAGKLSRESKFRPLPVHPSIFEVVLPAGRPRCRFCCSKFSLTR